MVGDRSISVGVLRLKGGHWHGLGWSGEAIVLDTILRTGHGRSWSRRELIAELILAIHELPHTDLN